MGYEVVGLDFFKPLPEHVFESLRQDVFRHSLLLVRNVDFGSDPNSRLLDITRKFRESAGSYVNPGTFVNVFQTSNQESGRIAYTGIWHTDDYPNLKPPVFAFYHMSNVSKNACTRFIAFHKLLECVPKEKVQYWSRLSVVFHANKAYPKPLVWQHPITKRPTMRFGIKTSDNYTLDYGLPTQKHMGSFLDENNEIIEMIDGKCSHLVYHHFWGEDELVISDNWANGHASGDVENNSVEEVGLRGIRRTLIPGTVQPEPYRID